jgi:hypothetical protein
MRKNNQETMSTRPVPPLRSILACAAIAVTLLLSGDADAQVNGVQPEVARQVPAPLPKLVLQGAVPEFKSGVHYHRIVLMITNWEKYSSEMFLVPTGRKLPPNPCAAVVTRVVITVYSDRGASLSGCIPMPKPADLGKFSFLFRRGPTPPDFVYVVIHDRYTGGAYRSNLVSPSTGLTK